jgi:hypothetical protein
MQAATSAGEPFASAGSGMPQCAVIGWPGQTGHVSPAALACGAVMGVVMALYFGDHGRLAITLFLLPGFISGCLLIAIAKLSKCQS